MDSSEDAATDVAADMTEDSADAEPDGMTSGCPEEAFDLVEATADVPFAIPDTFDDTSDTWMAPIDMCPADALSDESVPYVVYTYCNGRDVTTDYLFGMQADDEEGPLEPLLVAYSGTGIPSDPAACGAREEAFGGFTNVELAITLEPYEVVTIVSTLQSAAEGGFLSTAEPVAE